MNCERKARIWDVVLGSAACCLVNKYVFTEHVFIEYMFTEHLFTEHVFTNIRLLNIHRGTLITSCSRQLDTGWVNRLIDLIAVGIEAEYSVTDCRGTDY